MTHPCMTPRPPRVLLLLHTLSVPSGRDGIPAAHQYYDVKGDPGSLKQIQRLHWHSEFFKTFAGEGRMAAIASTLLGEVQRAGP